MIDIAGGDLWLGATLLCRHDSRPFVFLTCTYACAANQLNLGTCPTLLTVSFFFFFFFFSCLPSFNPKVQSIHIKQQEGCGRRPAGQEGGRRGLVLWGCVITPDVV